MEEREEDKSNIDFIDDEQEKLHLRFDSIGKENGEVILKYSKENVELKILRNILYIFISIGIISLIILIITNFHLAIIFVDIVFICLFIIYLKYNEKKYLKILKYTKKEYKNYLKKKKTMSLSFFNTIFDLLIIIFLILILIISMIRIDLLFLLIVIGFSFIIFNSEKKTSNNND